MRLLVTGAAGFLGSHLVDRLVADGHRVTGLDDLSTGSLARLAGARRSKAFGFHRFDLASADLPALVARDAPDVVCHLAARGDARDVVGTAALLAACAAAGVSRVVLASSGAVYGRAPVLPLTERVALHPLSAAAAAKVGAEAQLEAAGHEHGLPGVALRLGTVYGPRQETGAVGSFTRALLAGRPGVVCGDGRAVRDLVHVDDVVDAVVRCLGGRADGRRLNVGTGTGTTVRDLHAVVAAAVGAPDAPEYAPPRAGEPDAVVLDSGAARRALGWEPAADLAAGVAQTVAWWRAQP